MTRNSDLPFRIEQAYRRNGSKSSTMSNLNERTTERIRGLQHAVKTFATHVIAITRQAAATGSNRFDLTVEVEKNRDLCRTPNDGLLGDAAGKDLRVPCHY